MLSDSQAGVLAALNDHIEIHGAVELDSVSLPLPLQLADLGLPDAEVYQVVGDLYALGYIQGPKVAERPYPVRVDRLTETGRQELPLCMVGRPPGRHIKRQAAADIGTPQAAGPDDPAACLPWGLDGTAGRQVTAWRVSLIGRTERSVKPAALRDIAGLLGDQNATVAGYECRLLIVLTVKAPVVPAMAIELALDLVRGPLERRGLRVLSWLDVSARPEIQLTKGNPGQVSTV